MAVQKVLVSGANGFIASHTIEKLLLQGHEVVGTVRDPSDTKKVAHLWEMANAKSHLNLVAANLYDYNAFRDHVDVDVIFHMAGPHAINVKDPQSDLVDPAVRGTIAMLNAAHGSKRVKRVVITSSMAVFADQPVARILRENEWNTQSSLTRNPYYFSKRKAEISAGNFLDWRSPKFQVVFINPSIVVGPAHTATINRSNQIFVDLSKGVFPAIMALSWGFVDVRDVADAHIAAMNNKHNYERNICASASWDMADVVALMRSEGYGHTKLPKLDLSGVFGTALIKLASFSQPVGTGSYLRTHLGRWLHFSNERARLELGINFRSPEESIVDTLADLSRWGHLPKPIK